MLWGRHSSISRDLKRVFSIRNFCILPTFFLLGYITENNCILCKYRLYNGETFLQMVVPPGVFY